MNQKDTQQLEMFVRFLQDEQHAARQREKHLPGEVRGWLGEADRALGNRPDDGEG